MNTKYKIALSVLAGAALGAAAVQGLHAQSQPKAYIVTESEVLDAAALASSRPLVVAAVQGAGGRRLAPAGGQSVLASRSLKAWRKRRHTAIQQLIRI